MAVGEIDQRAAVEKYIAATSRRSDRDRTAIVKEKTGVDTGAFAIHERALEVQSDDARDRDGFRHRSLHER